VPTFERIASRAGRPDRLAVLALVSVYLGLAAFSHVVPFVPWLEVPIVIVPWLCMCIVGWSQRRDRLDLGAVRLDGLTLLFLLFVGAAFAFSLSGNVSDVCATTCIKLDTWRLSGDRYFRCTPPGSYEPDCRSGWVEIPRETYIAEVGSRLREAMVFGLLCLCVAWMLTWRTAPPQRTSPSAGPGR